MFEKLVEILLSYGVSVRHNDGIVYSRKDIGEVALVFDILKFNETFLVRIFLEDCAGDLTEIWERDILRSDEKQLYKLVEKMEDVFKEFEKHVSEDGSLDEPAIAQTVSAISEGCVITSIGFWLYDRISQTK